MLGIGPMEMMIIFLLALIVIGPRRLPEVLKTVGRVMAELRRTTDEVKREIMFDEQLMGMRDMLDPYTPPPSAPPKQAVLSDSLEKDEEDAEVSEEISEYPAMDQVEADEDKDV